MNKFDTLENYTSTCKNSMKPELYRFNAVNVNKFKRCRKFEEALMLFSFNNVVNVKNCESIGKFEESPILFSFYTEPHNVVNVQNAKVLENLKNQQ